MEVRIAHRIVADHYAELWRISAADCLSIVARGGCELRDSAVPANWDHGLTVTMAQRQLAIHEERDMPSLLADLCTSDPHAQEPAVQSSSHS